MNNPLLNSLRGLAQQPNGSVPARLPVRPDYREMTDFRTLRDYATYQAMKPRPSQDPQLQHLFFLARSSRMRARVETPIGEKLLFSGYNYLGLADDPRVIAAAQQALERYGTHAGAARMVGGQIDLHDDLERELAAFTGHEAGVVGVSGYGMNVAVLAHLLGPKDLLVHDSFMHNSGIAGAVQSGARRVAFTHNDLDHLERVLEAQRDQCERALILVEGAYSMDGDVADLPRLLELKRKHGCWLMVDEAHSIGTLGASGRGLSEHWGVDPRDVDITMGTLSKSLASCGGFVCGSEPLIGMLRNTAPGVLLYSTGISPANTAAALASLRLMQAEPQRLRTLQALSRRFCELARERGFDIGEARGLTPIVPLMVGEDLRAIHIAAALLAQGVLVHPILYPVVPRNAARFRFFLTAMHCEQDFVEVLDALAGLMAPGTA